MRAARIICAALLATVSAAAQDTSQTTFVDLRQGTDLSIATRPGVDFIVIELLGRLWRMPISGGAALPLTLADAQVRHPRMSHDGGQIVYQRHVDASWDIWILDLATGQQRAITTDPGNEREPEFLPDDGIVFAADRAGDYDLWSVDRDGTQWQPVSTERGNARFPHVADNGAIAYIVEHDGVHSLRIRSGGLTRTAYESRNTLGAPNWRPGGGVIIFSERGGASGAQLQMALLSPEWLIRTLSTGEDLFSSRIGWLDATRFLYTADGQIWRRQLAGRMRQPVHLFATVMVAESASRTTPPHMPTTPPAMASDQVSRDGTITVTATAGNIWLLRDGAAEQLTNDRSWDDTPIIDPAGRFVVFARNADGERRLWRVSVDQAEPPAVVTPPGVRAFAPALDPTGSRLAYLTSDGFSATAAAHLHTLYFDDGSEQRSTTAVQPLTAPQWLADNRLANITLETIDADGVRRNIAFDAALRVLPADVISQINTAAPPAPVSEAQAAVTPEPSIAAETEDDSGPPTDPPYVIQAGRLFDGLGTEYRRHVDIHIEAGRITAVVARDRLPLPATVIDATTLTVLPGLIDSHAHDLGLLGELAGRAWLAFGVTAVRSVGPYSAAQLALAAAWNNGQLPGPRFIQAPDSLLIDDPFRTLPGELPGIDVSQSRLPALPLDHRTATVRRYSPGLAHYQDTFALIAASGAAEITSLGVFAPGGLTQLLDAQPAARRAYEQLFSARDRERWRTTQPLVDAVAARQQALSRLLRAGGRVTVGAEAPATPPGIGAHIELALFAAAGVPHDQVLRAATANAALALGLEAEIGSVEAGRRADLLIVAGDPLGDLSAMLAIHAVVRDGRWIEPEALIAAPSAR